MAQRTGHGTGGGVPRIEVLPPDELPAGTPAPARRARREQGSGRFEKGPGTSELARAGGKAKAEANQLARLVGLTQPLEGSPFAPYARLAREFRDAHMSELAATVGGGKIGPGPASIVSTAALQLAASRYLHDEGAAKGDAKLLLDASRLANDSRQNLLAAHELAAREAQARSAAGALPFAPQPLDSSRLIPTRKVKDESATG